MYANTAAGEVPAALAGDVTAVLGLCDIPSRCRTFAVDARHQRVRCEGGAHIYDDTSMKPATSTSTTIIASGDMNSTIADLRYAEKQWGYSQVPVSVVYTSPEEGIVNESPLTGNLEWDLDTQVSTMVPNSGRATVHV